MISNDCCNDKFNKTGNRSLKLKTQTEQIAKNKKSYMGEFLKRMLIS